MVRSSGMFQILSDPLGCAIYQALLQVHVSVSVDGAELQTVSKTVLFFHTLVSNIQHIGMTLSKGYKLMAFRTFMATVTNLC